MRSDTVYVRTRDLPRLRLAVTAAGSQASVAARAGISTVRLSQIMHGATKTVAVATASALEDAVNVHRGTLFTLPDADLARAYVTEGRAA